MKILVYGAGVLGSIYAAKLTQAGHEVWVLDRGKRLDDIWSYGIVLKDADTGWTATTYVKVVDRLRPHDSYDLVIVLMRRNQASAILPTLAANEHTFNILFMGNNAAGANELVEAFDADQALMGLPGAAGRFEGNKVVYEVLPGSQQPTTISELHGRTTPRLRRIAEVFESAGFPVAISPVMPDGSPHATISPVHR